MWTLRYVFIKLYGPGTIWVFYRSKGTALFYNLSFLPSSSLMSLCFLIIAHYETASLRVISLMFCFSAFQWTRFIALKCDPGQLLLWHLSVLSLVTSRGGDMYLLGWCLTRLTLAALQGHFVTKVTYTLTNRSVTLMSRDIKQPMKTRHDSAHAVDEVAVVTNSRSWGWLSITSVWRTHCLYVDLRCPHPAAYITRITLLTTLFPHDHRQPV